MKQRSGFGTRRTQPLSESLHQRLNSYALAASAAGVSLLALAQPSEARIVYTPTHHVIKPGHHYDLDLNHDGNSDFAIRVMSSQTSSGLYGSSLRALPAGSNAVEGAIGGYAYALKRGASINPRQYPFLGSLMALARAGGRPRGILHAGQWMNVGNRYLGLEAKIGGKNHYGWARFNVWVQQLSITATLTGYAYETIPGKPIIAGKTHGKDVITVEPASLGHLARGASAIPAWRAKEGR